MHTSLPTRCLRLALTAAALGLLVTLLLLQPPHARAQSDSTAPSLEVANVDGTSLVLVFNELLNESSTPATTDFTVDIGGTDYTPASIVVRGAEAALTLSTAAASGNTVTLDYTPGTNPVEDLAGNDAASLSAETVVNHTGATNDRPGFSSEAITISVDENTATGMNVGSAITVTGNGSNDTLDYSFPTAFDVFTVDDNGQVKTSAALDFETTSSYTVPLYVADSKNPAGTTDSEPDDSTKLTITVNNVDEAGAVTLPGTITGGQAATATLTDPDGTTSSESWQWSRADTATGTFTPISGATSNPYTPVAADVGKYLKAAVSYTDPQGGGKSATSAASSQVAAGNVDPSFSSMTATRSVNENSAAGTDIGSPVSATGGDSDPLHYWLTGDDASSFDIVSTSGQIRTKSGITYNYESTSSYDVTVNVRDNKDAAGDAEAMTDDSVDVTINLNNVDEAGTVTISGTELGGETLTATVTDIDGTVSSLTWQWARAASASGPFAPISGGTSNTYTTVDADVNRYLRATASYTDPQGSGKSANAVTGQIGASNNEPAFPSSETGARSVEENTAANMNISAPVAAQDDDMGETLHYTLGGADASHFSIDASSGQLKTKSALDHEDDASYTVTVSVSDNKDAAGNADGNAVDDTITVTITVTDVNEPPMITTTDSAEDVPENTTAVFTLTASDVDDGDTIEWSVQENNVDGIHFEISASGALSFKNAPNFENPQSFGDNPDNIYVVVVVATDSGNLTDEHNIAVRVTNVNEAPYSTPARPERRTTTRTSQSPPWWQRIRRQTWTPQPR